MKRNLTKIHLCEITARKFSLSIIFSSNSNHYYEHMAVHKATITQYVPRNSASNICYIVVIFLWIFHAAFYLAGKKMFWKAPQYNSYSWKWVFEWNRCLLENFLFPFYFSVFRVSTCNIKSFINDHEKHQTKTNSHNFALIAPEFQKTSVKSVVSQPKNTQN